MLLYSALSMSQAGIRGGSDNRGRNKTLPNLQMFGCVMRAAERETFVKNLLGLGTSGSLRGDSGALMQRIGPDSKDRGGILGGAIRFVFKH